jgi:D-threo-aldose 1-dehydrogenase
MSIDLRARRQLGRSALNLPPFGLGTGPLGNMYDDLPEAVVQSTLAAAWDGGVRYYDTAGWYGLGLAEHRLGTFLRQQMRADYVLTTKVGRTLKRPRDAANFDTGRWINVPGFEVVFDYTYDGIMRSYEQALQRLAINSVDGLAIHDLDRPYHGDAYDDHLRDLLDSGFKALVELKRSGDIKAVGMGFNVIEPLERVVGELDLDYALVAMPYTLLEQQGLHTAMAQCLARKIGVVIGAPFASGILAKGPGDDSPYAYQKAPPAVQDKVRLLDAVCKAHGVTLPQAALQFPLAHPAVVSLIAGGVSPREIGENLGSLQATIPTELWSDLRGQGLIDKEAPTP